MSSLTLSPIIDSTNIYFTKSKPENANLIAQKFEGKFGQVVLEASSLYVGALFENKNKSIDPYNKADYYALGAKVTGRIKATLLTKFTLNFDFEITDKDLEHLLMGLLQSSYNFDKYLKKPKSVNLEFSIPTNFSQSKLDYIQIISDSVDLTRDLVNDTPQAINPNTMPDIIDKQFVGVPNVSIQNLSYEKMIELGMDAIVAVGKASVNKPILVHTTIKPKADARKKIVLIGKGLCYDSGGLDIKTAGHMKDMKSDMGGSALMFGATLALAKLGLENVELHWISAFAENMIDGGAYKSDDILTSYSGQTIEIHNTDAEGRLTLADALSYATLLDPDYIVDAATLTGACIVALSEYNTALMSNDLNLKNKLLAKFESEMEPTVYTPMPEVLRQYVEGDISELMNTSTISRQSGHVTAGLFLSHFVDQNNFRNPKLSIPKPKAYPWVHLDIAGSAFNSKHNSLKATGATGQSVRSLVSWILDEDKMN
jgi:leucyl aminopeptidase